MKLKIKQKSIANTQAMSRLPRAWEEFAPLTQIRSSGSVVAFRPYDYQIELVNSIEKAQNTVIIKSRQLGVSETICCYLLMRCLTEPGFTAVVFSKTQKDSSDLCERIRNMAMSLGEKCPPFSTESKTKLIWMGLGHLEFLPVTARAARSIPSVSVIFFDEAAFIDGVEAVYQAAAPTLSMLGDKGKIIFCSTPNGRQGLFWRVLSSDGEDGDRVMQQISLVKEGKNKAVFLAYQNWNKVLLHYKAHPVYGQDIDWAQKQRVKHKLTQSQWNTEYELDLAESGANVFPPNLLSECANGGWLTPQYGRTYIAGIDPAFGSQDFFNLQIWDITTQPYDLVAEYRASLKTKDYNLSQTVQLLDQYNPAYVVCETNGGGMLILEELMKLRPHLNLGGCNTTNASKLLHTDRLVLLLERHALTYPPDSGFAIDTPHFVEYPNGKTRTRQAESGYHDDGIMSAAVAFSALEAATEGRWLDALVN